MKPMKSQFSRDVQGREKREREREKKDKERKERQRERKETKTKRERKRRRGLEQKKRFKKGTFIPPPLFICMEKTIPQRFYFESLFFLFLFVCCEMDSSLLLKEEEEECSHLLSSKETVEGRWICPDDEDVDVDLTEILTFLSDGSLTIDSPSFGLLKGRWLFEEEERGGGGEMGLKIYLNEGSLVDCETRIGWGLVRRGNDYWLRFGSGFFRKEDQSCFVTTVVKPAKR